jgi:hypothetical protein
MQANKVNKCSGVRLAHKIDVKKPREQYRSKVQARRVAFTSPAPSGTTLFHVLLEFIMGVRPNSLDTLEEKERELTTEFSLIYPSEQLSVTLGGSAMMSSHYHTAVPAMTKHDFQA